MKEIPNRTLLAVGLALVTIGIAMFLFRPTPVCPVAASSTACDFASEFDLVAMAILFVGVPLAVVGAGRSWSSRRPHDLSEGDTPDLTKPMVDQGLTYLYQRRPPIPPPP